MTRPDTESQDKPARLTAADLQPIVESLGTPRRDAHGRPYLDTPAGRLPLHGRTARATLRDRLTFAASAKHGADRKASRAVIDQAAGQILAACAAAPCDEPQTLDGPLLHVAGDWHDGLDDLPAGWKCPTGYEITAGGVWRIPPGDPDAETERPPVRIATGPIVVVRVLVDPEGDELADLAWRGTFGWTVRPVERFLTSSGRRLVAALANAGLPAIEGESRHVEKWLAEWEARNRRVIPAEKVARWIGWQPDGLFLLPGSLDRRILWRWPEQEDQAANLRPEGTLTGWQDAVRLLAADPYPLVLICAAFAASLLHPLGLGTVIVDVYAASTRGKTTSLKIAYSVWGAPLDEGENGIASWGSTLLQLEKVASAAQGIVIALDDSQKAAREKTGSEVIRTFLYAASGGRGRARGNAAGSNNPNRVPIRTLILSSGEKPLTEFGQVQGLAPRRLPFPRNPFPLTADPAAEARRIDRIMVGVLTNFGTAGPAFVAELQARLSHPDGPGLLRERHRVLVEQFRGATPITARRAPAAAAVLLAGQLAHEWGILPVPPPPWEVWEDLFLGADATEADDQGAAAIDVILGELAANPDRLWTQGGHLITPGGDLIERTPPRGYLAKVDVIGGVPHLVAVQEKVRELLTAAGYDFANVVRVWQGNKAILQVPEGTGASRVMRWTKRTTLGGKVKAPCLVFAREFVDPTTLGLGQGGEDDPDDGLGR